jgi:hypothetical protein
MLKTIRTCLIVLFAVGSVAAALAGTDPTIGEVYEVARTGHLDQAQEMMSQVLRDHPRSAKAHYVAAELYTRGGDSSRARQELDTAERLAPGLPFARPEAVQALQGELVQEQSTQRRPRYSQVRSPFAPGTLLLVLGGIGVLWLLMRRRTPTGGLYPQYPSAVPTGGPVNYGPGVASGMGSGIAGGLASGLAVGAGVVAAEEIAHHFLDGNRHDAGALPASSDVPGVPENGDMGGSDFGVSAASSWDDGSGSVGEDPGGGDDWT